jgi:hypothetical protein
MGAPHYTKSERDGEIIKLMIANGVPQEAIAQALRISVATLLRHYREELDTGYTEVYAKISANVVKQATKDDFKAVPAALSWMRSRGNWRENSAVDVNINGELSGRDSESLRKALASLLGISTEAVRQITDGRAERSVSGEPDDVH